MADKGLIALNKQSGGDNGGDGGDNVGDNVGDVSVMELTERQRKILDFIKIYPMVPVAQMAVMMAVKKRTIERELSVLKKQGIITREGSAKAGHWKIIYND